MMKNRLTYIDAAKGIGIILVVLGHLDKTGQLSREMIYAFHMPFFFFLSGIFVSDTKGFKKYFSDCIKRLYVPFAFFTVLDIIRQLVLHQNDFTVLEYAEKAALALIGWDYRFILNRALWFLFSLFAVKMLYYFIRKSSELKITVALLGFVFLFIGREYCKDYYNLYLFAIPGVSFFILGSFCKPFINSFDKAVNKRAYIFIPVMLVSFVLFAFTAHRNGDVDMTAYRYGCNNLLYIFNALLGSFVTLVAAVYISKIKWLSEPLVFYGKNSMVVLACHYYCCRHIIPDIFNQLGIEEYLYNFYVDLALTAVMLLISALLIWLFNKYLYFLIGAPKPIKKNIK